MDDTELAQAIARIRRAMPRNADVMAVCSKAETVIQRTERPANEPTHGRLSTSARASVHSPAHTIGDTNATDQTDERAEKAAHNAYMRRYMRKYRANKPRD